MVVEGLEILLDYRPLSRECIKRNSNPPVYWQASSLSSTTYEDYGNQAMERQPENLWHYRSIAQIHASLTFRNLLPSQLLSPHQPGTSPLWLSAGLLRAAPTSVNPGSAHAYGWYCLASYDETPWKQFSLSPQGIIVLLVWFKTHWGVEA